MDSLYLILGWGTPLGISLFIFFTCLGVAVLFWGISQLQKASSKK